MTLQGTGGTNDVGGCSNQLCVPLLPPLSISSGHPLSPPHFLLMPPVHSTFLARSFPLSLMCPAGPHCSLYPHPLLSHFPSPPASLLNSDLPTQSPSCPPVGQGSSFHSGRLLPSKELSCTGPAALSTMAPAGGRGSEAGDQGVGQDGSREMRRMSACPALATLA